MDWYEYRRRLASKFANYPAYAISTLIMFLTAFEANYNYGFGWMIVCEIIVALILFLIYPFVFYIGTYQYEDEKRKSNIFDADKMKMRYRKVCGSLPFFIVFTIVLNILVAIVRWNFGYVGAMIFIIPLSAAIILLGMLVINTEN